MKFIVDRQQPRILGLIAPAVVGNVDDVSVPLQSRMSPELGVHLLYVLLTEMQIADLDITDLTRTCPQLQLEANDGPALNVINLTEFLPKRLEGKRMELLGVVRPEVCLAFTDVERIEIRGMGKTRLRLPETIRLRKFV